MVVWFDDSANPQLVEFSKHMVPVALGKVIVWADAAADVKVTGLVCEPKKLMLPLDNNERLLVVPPGWKVMSPVDEPPMVSVWRRRDWMVEVDEESERPEPVVAERVATGVPAATPEIAKAEEVVDVPPTAKS